MFEALLLAAALQTAPAAGSGPVSAGDRALLARADPFARAPRSSRTRLDVSGASGRAMSLEIWRRDSDALVRFLDPKERGKYLLRGATGTYFISPGARQPIKLPPTHRLAGAVALDELLGSPLAESHELITARHEGGVVTFELAAKAATALYPRLRWVVAERDRLPLRADFLLADGRVARVLEWTEWRDRAALEPKSMLVKDVLRGGPPARVDIVEIEAREVPASLYSLTDSSERDRLD